MRSTQQPNNREIRGVDHGNDESPATTCITQEDPDERIVEEEGTTMTGGDYNNDNDERLLEDSVMTDMYTDASVVTTTNNYNRHHELEEVPATSRMTAPAPPQPYTTNGNDLLKDSRRTDPLSSCGEDDSSCCSSNSSTSRRNDRGPVVPSPPFPEKTPDEQPPQPEPQPHQEDEEEEESHSEHPQQQVHHHACYRTPQDPLVPFWSRLTEQFHHAITRFVVTLSVHAAQNPIAYVTTILVLSFGLVGIGFFTNFYLNVEETEIFSPFGSISRSHFAWRNEESGFLKSTRATTLVIHANGDNVLGFDPMERLFLAMDTVRNITGYHEICDGGDYYDDRTGEQTCRILSSTRFWYHDTNLFYEQTQGSNEIVIATLSQTEYPPGIPADHEYVLGKVQREENGYGNGTLTYVPAYFAYILLSNKEPATKEFELLVIEQLSALQRRWELEEGNDIRLEYFAERSFSDEFTRAIEEDMYLVILIFIMMSGFTCIVFFQSDRVQSRSGLGIGSVTTIGMSLMSGFGLLFIIGVPYTSMTTILPFVVFGVGLDDTFIITGAYLRTDATLDPVERVRITMTEVGTSIACTTITTIAAFVLTLTSSVPAIYWLALYAFPTIAIDFIYQITFFIAIMVLDERRIKEKREDIFICFVRPDIQVDNLHQHDDHHQQQQQQEGEEEGAPSKSEDDKVEELPQPPKHFADRLMAWYANELMRPVAKGVVVVIFIYFFALCIYRTTMLTQEFNVTDLFPEGSYAKDVLDAIEEYQERSLQVEIYFRNVNQSDPAVQAQMLEFVDEISVMPAFGQAPPLCWVRDFQLLKESEYWDELGVDGLSFEDQLQLALSNPVLREAFGMDIVHENGVISTSRCLIMMKNSYLEDVDNQISVLVGQRAVTNAQPINQGLAAGKENFFTFNQVYLLWEFFNIAVSELIINTVSSVVAVSLVALVFVPHWSAVFFVVPLTAIVYIDLLGTMQVAGLHINAVTYVCLVISIGLIVDFLMHILLRYNESTHLTREAKVKDTLETMGSSILLGGLSTFLGVIPLAFSTSEILRTVFTSLFAMVVLGVAHGLIFLPVILSVIGPLVDAPEDTSVTRIDSPTASYGKNDANSTFDSISSSDAGSPVKVSLSEC